jgi:hypothetical protein
MSRLKPSDVAQRWKRFTQPVTQPVKRLDGLREAIVRAIWQARPGEWTGDGAQVKWEEASDCAKEQAYEAADAVLAALPEQPGWRWRGLAGHFVCADRCCFHMTTDIGELRISTVGCYHPPSATSDKPHEIGSGRLYETMVFKLDGDKIVADEIDTEGYNDEDEAERGHIAMCEKYA